MLSDVHDTILGLVLAAGVADATEVAATLGLPIVTVDRVFDELEREGMIAPAPVQ